jgi:methylmalonyl-CoA epimerase
MKALSIDHVAFAVADLAETAAQLEKIFGCGFSRPEQVDSQGVRSAFLRLGETEVELVESISEHSPSMPLLPNPIRSFIDKHGEGLHHVCLKTDDLDQELGRLSAQGIQPLPSGISRNAQGKRIVFLNPKHTANMLIELVEDGG